MRGRDFLLLKMCRNQKVDKKNSQVKLGVRKKY